MTHSITTRIITRVAARALIDAALQAGQNLGFGAAIVVVDHAGHLVAAEREDGAPLFLAMDIARDKAWTAASWQVTSHYWGDYVQDPTVAALSGMPHVLAVGGGYPLFENGVLIGAIGISGGTLEQDEQAAEQAMASLGLTAAAG